MTSNRPVRQGSKSPARSLAGSKKGLHPEVWVPDNTSRTTRELQGVYHPHFTDGKGQAVQCPQPLCRVAAELGKGGLLTPEADSLKELQTTSHLPLRRCISGPALSRIQFKRYPSPPFCGANSGVPSSTATLLHCLHSVQESPLFRAMCVLTGNPKAFS